MYKIGYDEEKKQHFVYRFVGCGSHNEIIYRGTYTNCLIVAGAILENPDRPLEDCIKEVTNG